MVDHMFYVEPGRHRLRLEYAPLGVAVRDQEGITWQRFLNGWEPLSQTTNTHPVVDQDGAVILVPPHEKLEGLHSFPIPFKQGTYWRGSQHIRVWGDPEMVDLVDQNSGQVIGSAYLSDLIGPDKW